MTEPVMAEHHCTGCGQVHGGSSHENPEVAIARINREADVRIAEIQRGEFQKTELEAETEIAVAEIDAAAVVEESTVKADVLEDILTPPEQEPEPVVVVSDETAPPADMPADDEPPEIDTAPAVKKASNPWWG
jgi:hypothetical protein